MSKRFVFLREVDWKSRKERTMKEAFWTSPMLLGRPFCAGGGRRGQRTKRRRRKGEEEEGRIRPGR